MPKEFFKDKAELDSLFAEVDKIEQNKSPFNSADDLGAFFSSIDNDESQLEEQEFEQNPIKSIGKSIWNVLSFQLPASGAAAISTGPTFDILSQVATPSGRDINLPPGVTDEFGQIPESIKNKSRQRLLAWANERQQKGAEFSQDLIQNLDQVDSVMDAINWAGAAFGQGIAQIPTSVLTGGLSSVGQEIGSIYLASIQKIADEKAMTPEEVIEKGLDNSAVAISFGTAAGLMDRIGAGSVMKLFGKDSLKKELRSRAKRIIVDGIITESLTEGAQTIIEEIGASVGADKSFSEALKSVKADDVIEAMAQGAVAGGGISATGSLIRRKQQDQTQEQPEQQANLTPEVVANESPVEAFDIEKEAELAEIANEEQAFQDKEVELTEEQRKAVESILIDDSEQAPKIDSKSVSESEALPVGSDKDALTAPTEQAPVIQKEAKSEKPETEIVSGVVEGKEKVTLDKETFESQARESLTARGISESQVKASLELSDVRVQAWSKMTGKNPDEWYKTRLAGISAKSDLKEKTPPRGGVKFLSDERAFIILFEKADVSTYVHEMAHIYRRDLYRTSKEALPEFKGQIDSDIKALENWAFAGQKTRKWTVKAEERVASGFERYLATGKAPRPELSHIFQQMKDWLLDIYKRIEGSAIDVKVSKPIKEVFDNLLGGTGIKVAPGAEGIDPLDSIVKSKIKLRGKEDYTKNKKGQRVLRDEVKQLVDKFGRNVFKASGEFKSLDEVATDLGITEDQLIRDLLNYEKPAQRRERIKQQLQEQEESDLAALATKKQEKKDARKTKTKTTATPETDAQAKTLLKKQDDFGPQEELFQPENFTEQTKTPAFKKWFGDSKVVDEKGDPLVVYHGTDQDFDAFSLEKKGKSTDHSPEDVGFHFSDDPEQANLYSRSHEFKFIRWHEKELGEFPTAFTERQSSIMPVFLKMENPFLHKGIVDEKVINLAKAKGHDSIIISQPNRKEYVVFNPTQIKSAIGNRGTFEESDPNILHQPANIDDQGHLFKGTKEIFPKVHPSLEKAKQQKIDLGPTETGEEKLSVYQQFKKGMEEGKEGFIEWVQDDWRRVLRLTKAREIKLKDAANPYQRETLFHGRAGTRLLDSKEKIESVDTDIANTSKKLKIDNTELSADIMLYLHARHAPERNAVLGDGAAGITTARAEKILEDMKKVPHFKEVIRIADDLFQFHKQTLDILAEHQVISRSLLKDLREKYKFHVPLQRVFEGDDTKQFDQVLTGRGLDVKGSGIFKAYGSQRKVADIMTNIMANYQQAVIRAEKNRVDLATLKFARENNYMDGLFEEIRPEIAGVKFSALKKIKEGGKITGADVVFKEIKDPNVLSLREKGEQVYLKINDVHLAAAFRAVTREKIPKYLRWIQSITRFYSQLATRFNPEFVFSNKIRDIQEALVYVASEGSGTANVFGKEIKGQNLKSVVDWLRKKDTEGARLYQQMREDGGTTGGIGLSSREQVEIDIEKIRKINRSKPRRAALSVFTAIDKWNQIFEDSTRLSVYRAALDKGLTRDQAAVLAKESSINFNKQGKGGPVLNAAWMFSNASIQGSAKLLKAIKKKPQILAYVSATIASAVAAAAWWNDEQEPEWRDKVSPWDRLNGLNIVISSDKDKFNYITIPVSWGLKPIKVASDAVVDMANNADVDVPKAVSQILASLVEGYNPLGGTDFTSAILPTAFDVPVDVSRNKAWHGNKIFPDWDQDAPASVRYFRDLPRTTAGRAYIAAAETISEKTGHRIEISPEVMQYVGRQLVGGAGRFLDKLAMTSMAAIGEDDELAVRNIPFASRFYRSQDAERVRDNKVEIAKKMLTEQSRKRTKLKHEAEAIYFDLKKHSPKQQKQIINQLRKTRPELHERLLRTKKEDEKGLTQPERLAKRMSPEDRAQYIGLILSELRTDQERKEYRSELIKKGVLTSETQFHLDRR